MSDVTNVTAQTEELDINLDQPLRFTSISDTLYMNSVELCEKISSIMKSVFVDFEGCRMIPVPNSPIGQLQLQFYFNHREADVPAGMYKAVTKDGKNEASNQTLAAIRRHDRLLNEGDRYFLTDDGKSGLKKFFFDGATVFEKDGSVKWNRVCAEVSDSANQFMPTQLPQQLTQVSFIDPVKFVTMLYGASDEDGEGWVYNISVKRSMPNAMGYGNNSANFVLGIDRISVAQTKKLAAQYGLVFTNGLGIVR
jgi:hypothetical protein